MALLDGIDTTPPGQEKQDGSLLKGIDTTPPQPGWGSQAWDATKGWAVNNLPAAGKLAERTGARVLAAPGDLLVRGTQALSALSDRAGITTTPTPTLYDTNGQQLTGPGAPAQPLPSEAAINALRAQIDPDAGKAMQFADVVAPLLLSGGRSALTRINEAPGLFNKTAEGLGYLTGAGVDLGLSTVGGELGEKYIGGPEGAFIGSLLSGGARPAAQQGFGWSGRRAIADPNAPAIFDAMINPAGPNTMPTFGQVSGPGGKQLEKAVGSVAILRSGVNAARENAEQGIRQSVATGVGEVGNRSPNLAPVDPATTAGRIIDLSRMVNESEGQRVADQQQALEDAIGANTPVDVSPVAQTMTSLASAPTTGPANTRALNPRIADLNELIQRQNPVAPDGTMPYPPTAAYGGVKDLRSDLGARSNSADPLQGYYLDKSRAALTDVMRNTAEQAGQGPQFDTANLDYKTFKQTNQPWLERQGGSLDPGAAPANPTTIASRATAITGANPGYLTDIASQLGLDPARATLADVLSRQGQIRGDFTPSRWGSDYANVNPTVKQFIAQHAPTAQPYLENAATGGRAFDLQPERPGLSNSLGFLGGLAELLSKGHGVAGALGGLETPSVIRSLAGRTDIPALLAQYAIRQGLGAGRGSSTQ